MSVLWTLILCVISATTHEMNQCSRKKEVGGQLFERVYEEIQRGECYLAQQTRYDNYQPAEEESFDFIVVGGGSSGAVVASRLAENPHWTVLLLEAGGDPPKVTEIPRLSGVASGSEIDWQHKTQQQDEMFLGLIDKRSVISRGKVLGGTSILQVNYIRGNPKDYDHWEDLGNEGWGYLDVLPYFKKSEGLRASEVTSSYDFDVYHNRDGPLTVESMRDNGLSPLERAFSEAMAELGYDTYTDVNDGDQNGLFIIQGILHDKRRCSVAKAFLSENKPNLKISKNALVTQILIQNKSAYGVKMVQNDGKQIKIRANKEVILTAGAINNPKLLMLSGIGEKESLQKHGIEPLCPLEVGKNLHIDIKFLGIFYSLPYFEFDDTPSTIDYVEFLTRFSGPLTHIGPVRTIGMIQADSTDYSDISLLPAFFPRNSSGLGAFLNSRKIIPEIQEHFLKVNAILPIVSMTVALHRPKSRGKVVLHTPDHKDDMEISPNILDHEEDIRKLLQGIDFAAKLAGTRGFKELGAELYYADIPACREYAPPTMEYLYCALSHITVLAQNPSGTCKMGPVDDNDPQAVVNPRLQVYGMEHLRVADLSVAPSGITSENANIAAIMIGEKAADMIKQDWSLQRPDS